MDIIERARRARDWLRARIVNDWRAVTRRWSAWLAAAGALLNGFYLVMPQQALDLWRQLPADMRTAIPGGDRLVPTLLVGGALAAMFIKQRKGQANG